MTPCGVFWGTNPSAGSLKKLPPAAILLRFLRDETGGAPSPNPGCFLAPRSLERSCLTTGSNLELSRPLALPSSLRNPSPSYFRSTEHTRYPAPTSDLTTKCLCRRKMKRRAQKEETEKSHPPQNVHPTSQYHSLGALSIFLVLPEGKDEGGAT